MKNKKPKKLVLAKETIRNLEMRELKQVAGGDESGQPSGCGGLFTCNPGSECYNYFLTERTC